MSKEFPQCSHTLADLQELQSLSLRGKLAETRHRIAEWMKVWGEERTYVAFSGGKDSTVLLDIVRHDYPDIPAVFCDTGLEFTEVRDFVKTIDNVIWIKPKMKFVDVLKRYGFPVISKNTSMRLSRLANPDISQRHKGLLLGEILVNGGKSKYMLADKWRYMLKAPFKISDKCCDVMKKQPSRAYEKSSGRDRPLLGMMADDSKGRSDAWVKTGCNSFESNRPMSNPLGFWKERDIWAYIRLKSLPHSDIYGMGYDRTGCVFCLFGCNVEQAKYGENRFQKMEKTHPKLWKYCMENLGIKKVLAFMGLPHKYQADLFDHEPENKRP